MFQKSWFAGFMVGASLVGLVAFWYRSQLRTMQQKQDTSSSFYGDVIKEMEAEWADVPTERKLKIYASMAQDGMLTDAEE